MTNLIKNKKFTRIMAILLVVLIAFSTMFTLPVSAASGDKVTITFDYCYDSTGNTIKFQQTTVSDGYTVGTPGEELCKIFADGKEAYCIEPGHSLFSGNSLTENGSTVWKNLGTAKQKAINLALLYGKPGSGKNLSGTEDQKWIATQLIVWEFVSGCRSTNDGYKCTNTKYIDGICADGANPGVKSVYNAISKSLANYSTVPSFASAIASKAETYEMKYSDGKYSVTLTDSNKILDEFTFKTTNGITATKSGNKLTLTSTSAVNDALTFNSAKSMPDVGKTVLVPYGDASLQDVITGVENDADPIRAYFKVKTKYSVLSGAKHVLLCVNAQIRPEKIMVTELYPARCGDINFTSEKSQFDSYENENIYSIFHSLYSRIEKLSLLKPKGNWVKRTDLKKMMRCYFIER